MRNLILILAFLCAQNVFAQKFEGLALTPPMGWNSWNKFCGNISEKLVMEIADGMVESGMKDAGYEYIVIDDHWQIDRDADGNILPDSTKFPSGMKALADYVHSKGLKFGLYSDAGVRTCGGKPGSRGYEFQDARSYASWDVDYLKYDWCHSEGQGAEASYKLMRDALYKAGRPVVFSICEWGHNKPGEWAPGVGHLWRTGTDIVDVWDGIGSWGGGSGVIGIIDKQVGLEKYAGPGHWNDPDMLEVGNKNLTYVESKTHFSMWCMLAAPLIAGNDLRSMTDSTISILTNRELIAVDQDPLGKQGTRLSRSGELETWAKELSGGDWAVCFFNRGEEQVELSLTWGSLGLLIPLTGEYSIKNLWSQKPLGSLKDHFIEDIPSHGVIVVRLKKK